ncbi:hypothetical protein Pflav_029770 [Phytohabitans flavus]|uniref:HD domain-containing protein n=1 Tax=Phytohabitans flavus TaxID=1076124 RepID=A0A6F8XRZ3_9ACTN|nr:hypothetical protein [Phytohabitans flavus]BCB76567.1 hypothetical protein Pflav_029770 [Phytohabitans flavus]
MPTVSFTRMADGTKEDYDLLEPYAAEFCAGLPDRILAAVRELDGPAGGFLLTRYEHSLQTATRALHDGRDHEYVVMSLVHDIGDNLAPHTHSEMIGAVLRPFVRPELVWIARHHGLFQTYYYAHFRGRTATRGTPTGTTSGLTPACPGATATTRRASTRSIRRCRSRRSSRWCTRCSASRATCSSDPIQ